MIPLRPKIASGSTECGGVEIAFAELSYLHFWCSLHMPELIILYGRKAIHVLPNAESALGKRSVAPLFLGATSRTGFPRNSVNRAGSHIMVAISIDKVRR